MILYVSETHRGRGLGRALVERFQQAATEAGYATLVMGTLVRDTRAVAFWQALGFEPWKVTMRRESS